ncbi:MAG: T9SS type A sorting domain-containing protein [Bacteroidales bacterium]|nr:T9SS type A sorting domain-containing protein [Bacteroidales bacterium]
MKSQNAIATIGNITSCAGENVLVPIDVLDFNDVGAMTFYISYDTNNAEFLSIQNINPAIPGGITVNDFYGLIGIVYTYSDPFYITEETLFDLSFSFLGDSTALTFNPGTEIATVNLEIIPLDTFNGSIATSFQIIDHPDSVKSYPDNDVIFGITSLGNNEFQWQENTGNGWINLQNNATYSGVTTDTLVIYDVALSFNGYTYRCALTEDDCTLLSDVALLEVALAFPVATLGFISSCPDHEILEPIFVGDFMDVTAFTFNISFDPENLTYLDLQNIHPDLLTGTLTVSPMLVPPGIVIQWEDENPVSITSGTLLDIRFNYESQNHTFAFEEGTIVLNSFSNPINITLNNGAIEQYNTPVIIAQPLDETVMEFDDASFSVEASGASEFRWMISTDNGNSWNDLENNIPYYNTETSELIISPVTYDLDEYQYACRLNSEFCSLMSASATLSVDTLTYIENPGTMSPIKVYPVPFRDKVIVSLPIDFNCNSIAIYNVLGETCSFYNFYGNAQREINLELSSLPKGIYMLKIACLVNGKEMIDQKKILKTD